MDLMTFFKECAKTYAEPYYYFEFYRKGSNFLYVHRNMLMLSHDLTSKKYMTSSTENENYAEI